jgi:hypothetical protein
LLPILGFVRQLTKFLSWPDSTGTWFAPAVPNSKAADHRPTPTVPITIEKEIQKNDAIANKSMLVESYATAISK